MTKSALSNTPKSDTSARQHIDKDSEEDADLEASDEESL